MPPESFPDIWVKEFTVSVLTYLLNNTKHIKMLKSKIALLKPVSQFEECVGGQHRTKKGNSMRFISI
jgi:hypothetical protein